jgi:hypothetical protein
MLKSVSTKTVYDVNHPKSTEVKKTDYRKLIET